MTVTILFRPKASADKWSTKKILRLQLEKSQKTLETENVQKSIKIFTKFLIFQSLRLSFLLSHKKITSKWRKNIFYFWQLDFSLIFNFSREFCRNFEKHVKLVVFLEIWRKNENLKIWRKILGTIGSAGQNA